MATVRVHPLWLGMSFAFLVEINRALLLVDAGLVRREGVILRRIEELGYIPADLRLIYLTHAHLDHSGSAAAMQRMTRVPIAIHAADADDLRAGRTNLGEPREFGRYVAHFLPIVETFMGPHPAEPDILVDDEAVLDHFEIPLRVLHVPGHTDGSTALLLDDENGETIAFAGDLLTAGRTRGPQPQRGFATNWAAIPQSVAKLAAERPTRTYVGHGELSPLSLVQIEALIYS